MHPKSIRCDAAIALSFSGLVIALLRDADQRFRIDAAFKNTDGSQTLTKIKCK
jgi:hypothetical protein